MTKMESISVATSLAPGRDIELQRTAIESWQRIGFTVSSLNDPREVPEVKRQFPGVAVMSATRTAEKATGKPLPYVVDLLRTAAAHNKTASVVGFMNADIILRSGPALGQVLASTAAHAAVLLPRVDIPDIKSAGLFVPTGSEKYSVGYDGVFMPPRMIENLPENIFCIGMPFWDYWLPLMLALQGLDVKTIASPVALHVHHETRWDQSIYLFFHALMSDVLKVTAAQKLKSTTPALEIMIDMMQHSYEDIFKRATQTGADTASIDSLASYYDRIQEVVVHHIKAKAQPLKVPEAASHTS